LPPEWQVRSRRSDDLDDGSNGLGRPCPAGLRLLRRRSGRNGVRRDAGPVQPRLPLLRTCAYARAYRREAPVDLLPVILACSLRPDHQLVEAFIRKASDANLIFLGDFVTLATHDDLTSPSLPRRSPRRVAGRRSASWPFRSRGQRASTRSPWTPWTPARTSRSGRR